MQNIGNMDIDQIIDVPDTPDRLASRHIGKEVCVENGNNTLVACDSGKSKLTLRGRNRLISENGFHRGLHFPSQKNLNNPEATEQLNSTFRSSEGSSASRNNHIYRRVIDSGIPKNENRNSNWVRLIDKGKLSCDKSRANTSSFEERNIELDSMKQNRKLGNALNPFLLADDFKEGPTETNGSLHRRQNSLNTNDIYCKGKEKASEGIDLTGDTPPKIGKFVTPSVHHIASPRVTGQKRLVRNGCISPLNIAKMKQSTEQKQDTCGSQDVGNTNTQNLVSRNPSCTIDINDSSAEGSNRVRIKGKGLLHSSTAREVVAKTRHMTGSSSTSHNQDTNGTNSGNENTSETTEELFGWRSTGNRSRKMHLPLHDEDANLPRTKAANSLIKRQKNHGSTSSNHGKGSKSRSDDAEIMMFGSSLESSNSRPTRNWSGRRRSVLDPVIEVDELSPELGPQNNNSASEARVRQLEADEILALELQQQFYQETPIQGGRENIDEHIAWTLHQEEAAERASSSGRHDILNPRASSISAMHSVTDLVLEAGRNYRQPRLRALPNSSNRRRLPSRTSTSARMTQLRNLHNQTPSMLARGRHVFPPDMDLDMRIDILEALEAMDSDFGDMRMGNHMLQVNRDFNENDYEMLLALDENNDQHGGARIDQINRLPQSTVQTEILEEACSICLENPTMGETIRHLPCLHKFHKDCIDPWLSRKRSCPVCKSSIT